MTAEQKAETRYKEIKEIQEQTEQDVFHGLNSTDTIMNLIKEGLQAISEVSVRQEGLCMTMEMITDSLAGLQETEPAKRKEQDFARVRESLEQVAGLLVSGDENMVRAVNLFQTALEEAENANQTIHTVEERLLDYFERSEQQYEYLKKGNQSE